MSETFLEKYKKYIAIGGGIVVAGLALWGLFSLGDEDPEENKKP